MKHRHLVMVMGLLLLFFTQVWTTALQTSVTVDEFAHLPAGLSYWKTLDFKVYGHNPPLIKLLAAIPLLSSSAKLPDEFNGRWQLGYQFMHQNQYQYHSLFLRGRFMILLLSLLLAGLIYNFTKQIYGKNAALLSLTIFAFSPNLIAHSGLVTTDVGTCLGIFFALTRLFFYLQHPTPKNLILCGIAFGLAQLTKFSALILVFAYPILMIVDGVWGSRNISIKKIALSLLVIFGMSMVIINMGYFFQKTMTPLREYSFRSSFFTSIQSYFPGNMPIPLPKEYVRGVDAQKAESDNSPVSVYLFGNISKKGWWYYYPMAFLYKTPLPILLIFSWAVIIFFSNTRQGKKDFLFVFMMVFIVLYFILFFRVVNLGIRYFLPIYPLIFVLSGKVAAELFKRQRQLLFLLLIWLCINAIQIYPHHLSFFNELAGGPSNGHRILADSNLDWGQDLIHLKKYMTTHGIQTIYLSHFGLVDPAIYGIQYQLLPPYKIPGIIAISVNHYLGIAAWKRVDHMYRFLHEERPIDRVGYSIMIFKFGSSPN